jgi:hypothetical protein
MNKKRWGLLVIAAALLIVCVLGIKSVIEKRAARKHQTEYEAVLGVFRHPEVRHATTRSRVLSSTEGRSFRQMCCIRGPRNAYADIVKIGEEKAPWYCNKYNVYVAFEFETTEPHGIVPDARDSDRLETTSLFPWLEECL